AQEGEASAARDAQELREGVQGEEWPRGELPGRHRPGGGRVPEVQDDQEATGSVHQVARCRAVRCGAFERARSMKPSWVTDLPVACADFAADRSKSRKRSTDNRTGVLLLFTREASFLPVVFLVDVIPSARWERCSSSGGGGCDGDEQHCPR
ncbi:unnamed protein product, partial [Ectocarpus sp. 8 AP-2014]